MNTSNAVPDIRFAKTIQLLLAILSILIVILPSGKIYHFNSKVFVSVVLVLLLAVNLLRIDFRKIRKFIICSALFMIFLAISVSVGYFNGFSSTVLHEASLFVGLYLVFSLFYLANILEILNKRIFFLTIVISSFVLYILKVIVFFIIFFKPDASDTLRNAIAIIFSVSPMIGHLDSNWIKPIVRVNFIFDLVAIYLVVFYKDIADICSSLKRKKFLFPYLIFASFSIYASCSRYIWGAFLLLVFVRILINRKNNFEKMIFSISTLAFFLFVLSFSNPVRRFSGAVVQSSDKLRIVQSNVIKDMFLEHPIFGIGMGGYSKNCIRSEISPFIYESQIQSLFMKFGVVGVFILFVILGFYIRKLYVDASIFTLFSFFIALCYGFFNPYIVQSAFSLLMFMLYLLNANNRTHILGNPV